jgi:hypothetical protein
MTIDPSGCRQRCFPDHADSAKRKPCAEIMFRRFIRFSHSLWRLSHSERIRHLSRAIRHSFDSAAIARSPKKANCGAQS